MSDDPRPPEQKPNEGEDAASRLLDRSPPDAYLNAWKKALRRTLEFEGGVPRYERASFRAYGDVASTMNDYVNLLASNPRYEGVVGRGNDTDGFADALQQGGYATDPQYARKLKNVIESPTMQRVLSGLKKPASLPTSEGLSARAQ